jgi:hypothetical protein
VKNARMGRKLFSFSLNFKKKNNNGGPLLKKRGIIAQTWHDFCFIINNSCRRSLWGLALSF